MVEGINNYTIKTTFTDTKNGRIESPQFRTYSDFSDYKDLPEIEKKALRLAVLEMLIAGKDNKTGLHALKNILANSSSLEDAKKEKIGEAVKALFEDILKEQYPDAIRPNDQLVRNTNLVFLALRGGEIETTLKAAFDFLQEKGVLSKAPTKAELMAAHKLSELRIYNRFSLDNIYPDLEVAGSAALQLVDRYWLGNLEELLAKYPNVKAKYPSIYSAGLISGISTGGTGSAEAENPIHEDVPIWGPDYDKPIYGFIAKTLFSNARISFEGEGNTRDKLGASAWLRNAKGELIRTIVKTNKEVENDYKEDVIAELEDNFRNRIRVNVTAASFTARMNVYENNATYYVPETQYYARDQFPARADVAYELTCEAVNNRLNELRNYSEKDENILYMIEEYERVLAELKELGNEQKLTNPPVFQYVVRDSEKGSFEKTLRDNKDTTPIVTYSEMLREILNGMEEYKNKNFPTTNAGWAKLYNDLRLNDGNKSKANANPPTLNETDFWYSFAQIARSGIFTVQLDLPAYTEGADIENYVWVIVGYEQTVVGSTRVKVEHDTDSGTIYYFEKEVFQPEVEALKLAIETAIRTKSAGDVAKVRKLPALTLQPPAEALKLAIETAIRTKSAGDVAKVRKLFNELEEKSIAAIKGQADLGYEAETIHVAVENILENLYGLNGLEGLVKALEQAATVKPLDPAHYERERLQKIKEGIVALSQMKINTVAEALQRQAELKKLTDEYAAIEQSWRDNFPGRALGDRREILIPGQQKDEYELRLRQRDFRDMEELPCQDQNKVYKGLSDSNSQVQFWNDLNIPFCLAAAQSVLNDIKANLESVQTFSDVAQKINDSLQEAITNGIKNREPDLLMEGPDGELVPNMPIIKNTIEGIFNGQGSDTNYENCLDGVADTTSNLRTNDNLQRVPRDVRASADEQTRALLGNLNARAAETIQKAQDAVLVVPNAVANIEGLRVKALYEIEDEAIRMLANPDMDEEAFNNIVENLREQIRYNQSVARAIKNPETKGLGSDCCFIGAVGTRLKSEENLANLRRIFTSDTDVEGKVNTVLSNVKVMPPEGVNEDVMAILDDLTSDAPDSLPALYGNFHAAKRALPADPSTARQEYIDKVDGNLSAAYRALQKKIQEFYVPCLKRIREAIKKDLGSVRFTDRMLTDASNQGYYINPSQFNFQIGDNMGEITALEDFMLKSLADEVREDVETAARFKAEQMRIAFANAAAKKAQDKAKEVGSANTGNISRPASNADQVMARKDIIEGAIEEQEKKDKAEYDATWENYINELFPGLDAKQPSLELPADDLRKIVNDELERLSMRIITEGENQKALLPRLYFSYQGATIDSETMFNSYREDPLYKNYSDAQIAYLIETRNLRNGNEDYMQNGIKIFSDIMFSEPKDPPASGSSISATVSNESAQITYGYNGEKLDAAAALTLPWTLFTDKPGDKFAFDAYGRFSPWKKTDNQWLRGLRFDFATGINYRTEAKEAVAMVSSGSVQQQSGVTLKNDHQSVSTWSPGGSQSTTTTVSTTQVSTTRNEAGGINDNRQNGSLEYVVDLNAPFDDCEIEFVVTDSQGKTVKKSAQNGSVSFDCDDFTNASFAIGDLTITATIISSVGNHQFVNSLMFTDTIPYEPDQFGIAAGATLGQLQRGPISQPVVTEDIIQPPHWTNPQTKIDITATFSAEAVAQDYEVLLTVRRDGTATGVDLYRVSASEGMTFNLVEIESKLGLSAPADIGAVLFIEGTLVEKGTNNEIELYENGQPIASKRALMKLIYREDVLDNNTPKLFIDNKDGANGMDFGSVTNQQQPLEVSDPYTQNDLRWYAMPGVNYSWWDNWRVYNALGEYAGVAMLNAQLKFGGIFRGQHLWNTDIDSALAGNTMQVDYAEEGFNFIADYYAGMRVDGGFEFNNESKIYLGGSIFAERPADPFSDIYDQALIPKFSDKLDYGFGFNVRGRKNIFWHTDLGLAWSKRDEDVRFNPYVQGGIGWNGGGGGEANARVGFMGNVFNFALSAYQNVGNTGHRAGLLFDVDANGNWKTTLGWQYLFGLDKR